MKKWIERYKEMRKNPREKALLFFAFYFVFFAVIIAFLKFSSPRPYNAYEELEDEVILSFPTESFIHQSYHFQYTVFLDGITHKYACEKVEQTESFTFQDKRYYYTGEDYYVKQDEWIKSENPYLFSIFRDEEKIFSLFQNAYLESKTSYKSGKTTYYFMLDSNVLSKTLYEKDTDYADDGNMTVVSVNEDQKVDTVSFQLNNYCKSSSLCTNSLKIDIHYDQFDEILAISDPLVS